MRTSLPGTAAAVAVCAVLGSVASREVAGPWYASVRKPRIQPPAAVFPVVWTTLYADLALTSAVVIDRLRAPADDQERPYVWALGVNLVLNTAWSWTFFKGHRFDAATVVAGALAASTVDLVRRTADVDARAGAALAPYAAWCTFATVLSAALWRVNR